MDKINDVVKVPQKRGRKPGSKGHCSYCGEVGHYKKTCPKYKKEVAEGTNLVEVNLNNPMISAYGRPSVLLRNSARFVGRWVLNRFIYSDTPGERCWQSSIR
jgi:hypothetical protein